MEHSIEIMHGYLNQMKILTYFIYVFIYFMETFDLTEHGLNKLMRNDPVIGRRGNILLLLELDETRLIFNYIFYIYCMCSCQ